MVAGFGLIIFIGLAFLIGLGFVYDLDRELEEEIVEELA